jgi:predicted phosphodiesterase
MLVCKKCGSSDTVKRGKKDYVQRYVCKECGKWSKVSIQDKTIQKKQDTKRLMGKGKRNSTRIENAFAEYIQKLTDVISDKKFPPAKPHGDMSPSTIIIHLSDLHFNELVDIVGNKYDFNIASKRLHKFAEKIQMYLKVHNINNVYLTLTGDIINSDRRTDELLSMATNRAKATILGAKLLSQFILDINRFANVNVISVSGNESRIREEYTHIGALGTDNFDFMIYEIMKILFENNKGVNFISGDTFEFLFGINGSTFLLCHGHNLRKMNDTVINKVITKWSKKGVNVDLILCGHIHETLITNTLARNGSLVGNNAYADVSLNLEGKASQNIHLVYKDGSIDSIKVDLQDVDEKSKMYNIDKDLEAYDVRNVNKKKENVKVFNVKL